MIGNSFSGNLPFGSPEGVPAVTEAVQTTGRFVVIFADQESAPQEVLQEAGLANVADSRDFGKESADVSATSGADAIVLNNLNIAVVTAEADQLGAMQASSSHAGAVLAVEPELVFHVLDYAPTDHLTAAYRAVVADLAQLLPMDGVAPAAPPVFSDNTQHTWGIQAVQANASAYSGNGVRVAVLDTGFDLQHPDFAGRNITTKSFISGQQPQDGHGHGTHCIGTACGPKKPANGPRYGVAYEADIFVGKVLSDQGSGSTASVLAGMDWAIEEKCPIISMSLGANVTQAQASYTVAGRRALDKGSLIIAAAGNNANRVNKNFGFVGSPANSRYVMAVGALTQQLNTAFFSARTLDINGGQVDVAAPGYQVYSSWPMPRRYHTISGTSMATPHAAGVAALVAQKTGYRGRELWSEIVQESHRLLEPSADVGSGLLIAPQ